MECKLDGGLRFPHLCCILHDVLDHWLKQVPFTIFDDHRSIITDHNQGSTALSATVTHEMGRGEAAHVVSTNKKPWESPVRNLSYK